MSKNNNSGDFQMCFEMAKAFDDAAVQCIEDKGFFAGYVIYPFSVNAALACELYMKAIMISSSDNNEFVEGHHFDELFLELPEEAKTTIQEIYSKFAHSKFDDMLNRNKNVFAEWRYSFEGKHIVVEPLGLLDFLDALRQYIEDKILNKNGAVGTNDEG